MASGRVVVISWSVEISWHQADGVESMLFAQRFAQLDSSDFGNGLPLVSGLKGAREQGFFADGLLGKFWVDAAAS